MTKLAIPKNIEQWLTDPVKQIGSYYNKAQQLMRFNHRWKQQKDLPLVLHSTLANWQDTILVIAVDSGAWATHLQYTRLDLLAHLQKNWPELKTLSEIKWYIKPPVYYPQEIVAELRKASLSQENKQLLNAVAGTLTHTPLQEALRRLAQR